jgi:hypothetical protein
MEKKNCFFFIFLKIYYSQLPRGLKIKKYPRVSHGADMWRFHPVSIHGLQPGGKAWNLNIARENLREIFL